MKTPKLLPWYASKAGVSRERACALWREAVRQATAATGWVGSPEYWSASMDAFQRLLDKEKQSACTPRVTSIVRSQHALWRLPLIALEDLVAAFGMRQRNPEQQQADAPWRKAA